MPFRSGPVPSRRVAAPLRVISSASTKFETTPMLTVTPIARSTGRLEVASRAKTMSVEREQTRMACSVRRCSDGSSRGVFEEQRVVEPEARGENQRDEMKQRQRSACGLQHSDDDQASSASSAQSRESRAAHRAGRSRRRRSAVRPRPRGSTTCARAVRRPAIRTPPSGQAGSHPGLHWSPASAARPASATPLKVTSAVVCCIALVQQHVEAGAKRRLAQVIDRQRRQRARPFDIVDERLECFSAKR